MSRKILRFAAISLVAVSIPAMAQLYRWVDADGKVHYSDQPPAQAKSKKFDTDPAPPPAGTTSAPVPAQRAPSWNEKDAALRSRMESKQRVADLEQQQQAAQRAGCERAKEELRKAENAPAIRDDFGNNNFAARTANINRAQANANAACR